MRPWICVCLATILVGCDSSVTPAPPSRYLPKKPAADGVVVFIHGVTGDSDATWRNGTTQAYWPALLAADADRARDDVYIVSYGSPKFSSSSNIEQISQRVLQQLTDAGVFRYNRVYFVAHSMGGLITKRMMVNLYRPPTIDMFKRVRAAVLISTPSQGAPLADIGKWLSKNPQVEDMEPHDFNTFLQTLENDWQLLLRQRDRARENFPQAYCAYETVPTKGVRVVTGLYAATRCDNTPYPMDYDHVAIVKPRDRTVDPYPWAKARISEADALVAAGIEATNGEKEFTARYANAAGNNHFKRGDLLAAFEAYRRAQQLDPSEALYVANEGAVLTQAGLAARAQEAYQRAVVLDPGVAWYRNELCKSLFRGGQVEAAGSECRAAIRLEPKNAEYHRQFDAVLAAAHPRARGG